jgi:hypothetical protein
MSGKGHAKGRKQPSFHFWTKKRIKVGVSGIESKCFNRLPGTILLIFPCYFLKVFIEDRMKHRELVRKQQANLPIKNFGK